MYVVLYYSKDNQYSVWKMNIGEMKLVSHNDGKVSIAIFNTKNEAIEYAQSLIDEVPIVSKTFGISLKKPELVILC